MLKKYQAKHQELATRLFKCARCGAHGDVVFLAKGVSSWHHETLLGETAVLDAHAEAEQDLRLDADRALAMVRCPTCKQRSRGAFGWAVFRVGFWIALAVGTLMISTIMEFKIAAAGFAAGALAMFFAERSRMLRAGRAQFVKLTHGKKPPELEAPRPAKVKPELPVARALVAPPAPAPQPPAPIVAPPPAPPPPKPGDEPSFLRDKT